MGFPTGRQTHETETDVHDDNDIGFCRSLESQLITHLSIQLLSQSLPSLPATMSSKAALKAIVEAVKQHKFDDAIQHAHELLQKDPKNYQA